MNESAVVQTTMTFYTRGRLLLLNVTFWCKDHLHNKEHPVLRFIEFSFLHTMVIVVKRLTHLFMDTEMSLFNLFVSCTSIYSIL